MKSRDKIHNRNLHFCTYLHAEMGYFFSWVWARSVEGLYFYIRWSCFPMTYKYGVISFLSFKGNIWMSCPHIFISKWSKTQKKRKSYILYISIGISRMTVFSFFAEGKFCSLVPQSLQRSLYLTSAAALMRHFQMLFFIMTLLFPGRINLHSWPSEQVQNAVNWAGASGWKM